MPSRRPLRNRLLGLFLICVSLAYAATPLVNPRVRKLGDLFECQCGCKASVTSCYMIKCHSSDPMREELLAMVEAGQSDDQIVAAMVARHGKHILRNPPSDGFFMVGWVMPFAGVAVGLTLVVLALRYYLKRRPATVGTPVDAGADAPEVARYRDRIEKEMADLDS